MTNIYNLEPQAKGSILLQTTFGDIEVELFTQQCPKATRNFVQLCLDGYYDGTIFNRVEKGFIAVGGIAEEDMNQAECTRFPDEFHPRLKFTRRGLLATANTEANSNGPEFFFSLGPAQELQNKHTIFGRVKGNSIYKLEDGLNLCQVDDDLRPSSEKKVLKAIVVENPYPELKANARSQEHRDLAQGEPFYDPVNRARPKYEETKKLSFFQDSEDEDDEPDQSSHNGGDIDDGQRQQLDSQRISKLNNEVQESKSAENPAGNDTGSREKVEISREERLQQIRAQVENLKRQLESESAPNKKMKQKNNEVMTETSDKQDNMGPKTKHDRQSETIQLVRNFKFKLKQTSSRQRDAEQTGRTSSNLNDDDILSQLDRIGNDDWMNHKFEAGPEDADECVLKWQ